MEDRPLDRAFFARPVDVVARALVGVTLRRGDVTLRLVEVEAYSGSETGCHAFAGRTARNAPLFGPPGHLYVYLCYGIHHMVNIVCDAEGVAAGVLLRSAEVIAGFDVVSARRGGRSGPDVCAGPGKIGAALALSPRDSGSDLFNDGRTTFWPPLAPVRLLAGPRVGIDSARPRDRRRPWRFADADSVAVTHRQGLRPLRRPR